MSTKKFSFGYKQDLPDPRDYKYTALATTLPESVDLSGEFLPIRNQGNLGACTAFATGAMVEYVRNKQQLKMWSVSTLFTYYATRQIEGTVDSDSGAYVRDALKSAVNYGVTSEETWPYDITVFKQNPPENAWEDALNHQAVVYYRIDPTRENILSCLAEGYPFSFGMKLYQSFVDTQCGFMVHNYLPMPDTSKEKLLGGHCMLAVGYSKWIDGNTYIKVRNSWGTHVGLGGYHNIPIDYFLDPNLSSDFWTIRSEEYTEDEIIKPPAPPAPEPVVPPIPPKPEPVVPPAPVEVIEEDKGTKIMRWVVIAFFALVSLIFLCVR